MRIEIPINKNTNPDRTNAQAILELSPDELASQAAEQGYDKPISKAEDIHARAKKEREAEIEEILGETKEVGRRALLLLDRGTGTVLIPEEAKDTLANR